jgi:hypothetical protein
VKLRKYRKGKDVWCRFSTQGLKIEGLKYTKYSCVNWMGIQNRLSKCLFYFQFLCKDSRVWSLALRIHVTYGFTFAKLVA